LGLKAGVPEPPAPTVNCPPSIIGMTVAGVENVSDDCVILDAIIENGDVNAKQVANFYMQETEVRDGDIEVDAVDSSTQITRNRVLNGDIKVTGSQNVGVYLNIVNGELDVNGNDGATVDGNIVNGNIKVDENSGLDITRVIQNIATGNGSITVEDNEVVEVTDNRASRDLKCKDNQQVIASGNNAQRKLECESGSQDDR
jgi:hypothetical protein